MKNLILTERQSEILKFIILNKEKYGYPPSIPEIQENFSFKSPNAVQDHLGALERKGYISRRAHKARGIEVLGHATSNKNDKNNAIEIPIVGEISAGRPILAQENIEGNIVIDKSIVKNSNGIFALRVKGDSMVNAGILNGDYVIVSQQQDADQGDIVVALIEDEATVKRFYKEKNRIRLQPENDTMEPIIINQLLTIREATKWAAGFLQKQVSTSNISYLVQYGRIRKFGENGEVLIDIADLENYYKSYYHTKEDKWKRRLGNDLNWALSFSEYKESETTKHVHRLHPYKGKFIPQLVEYFLDSHIDNFKKEYIYEKI